VTIKSRSFLNVDLVNPISETHPFTYDFFQGVSFETPTFVDAFVELLTRILSEGLTVTGVTSDGCAFQKKALCWRDPASIQAREAEYSRLIFVPCVCHRLQNSMVELFNQNDWYRELIIEAREIAVFLRKPAPRTAIGATCPGHCATRWIYDYPLVRFLCTHFDQAEQLLQAAGRDIHREILLLLPLLEKSIQQ
jgi:hypothetical protein